jgi:transcriptional regulator with XRE-family HTH domain
MSVSNKLVKLMREERGWSQEQLATISGISERTVQRVEKDGKCSLESKMALSSAFEVSPIDLEDNVQSDVLFEQNRIEWTSVTGYIILLIILPILLFLLTNTHGIWEIGCLLIVEGLTLAISTASHGVDETIRFFRNSFLPVRKVANSNNYKVYIILANQVIRYAYTFGCLTSLIYLLVILTHVPDRFHHINIVLAEMAFPIVYSILLTELWIRPFKHKVEKRLAEAMSNKRQEPIQKAY